jgi:hypothetical protein
MAGASKGLSTFLALVTPISEKNVQDLSIASCLGRYLSLLNDLLFILAVISCRISILSKYKEHHVNKLGCRRRDTVERG